jgi:DNA-binding winged helix-turn-helix (wHTH) protein
MPVFSIRPAAADRRLAFGPFRFDPASGILDDSVRTVRLRSQVGRLLEYLIQHRDEQISREQLCEVLWGPQAVLGTQTNALDRVLADLRRDLGPQSRELLRKEGRGHYRFSVDDAAQPLEAAPETTPLYVPFPAAELALRKLPYRSEVYIYSENPLEQEETFARAAMANMGNQVFYTFFIPSRAAHVIPNLVVSLLLAPRDAVNPWEHLEKNADVVRTGVRIVLTAEISPWIEFIVHNAGAEEAQAYARYPSAQLCGRYGEAQVAKEIVGRLRRELLTEPPAQGLIWYPPGFCDDAAMRALKAELHRHLQRFGENFGRKTLQELLNLPPAT